MPILICGSILVVSLALLRQLAVTQSKQRAAFQLPLAKQMRARSDHWNLTDSQEVLK